MHLIFIICGYFGTFFLVASYLPQVVKILKNDNSRDKVSNKFLFLQVFTCLMFIIYSIGFFTVNSLDGLPIFISNVIVLFCLMMIQWKRKFGQVEIQEENKT